MIGVSDKERQRILKKVREEIRTSIFCGKAMKIRVPVV
jgi:hypothetical protein